MNSKISYIADEEGGPAVAVEITLPDDGGQIWTGEASKHLLKESSAAGFDPASSGIYLVAAPFGEDAQVVAQVSTPQQAIDLALAMALRAEMTVDPSAYSPLTESDIGRYDEWLGRKVTAYDIKAHPDHDHIADGGKMVPAGPRERLSQYAKGMPIYRAYRGQAPDGEPTLKRDIEAMLTAAPVVGEPVSLPISILDIAAERRRQVDVEGYSHKSDDDYEMGELGLAAALYALPYEAERGGEKLLSQDDYIGLHIAMDVSSGWHIKPEPDRRRRLVKAGALISAEIERLDRLARLAQIKGGPDVS